MVAALFMRARADPPALDRELSGGSQERGILILAQQGGSLATTLK